MIAEFGRAEQQNRMLHRAHLLQRTVEVLGELGFELFAVRDRFGQQSAEELLIAVIKFLRRQVARFGVLLVDQGGNNQSERFRRAERIDQPLVETEQRELPGKSPVTVRRDPGGFSLVAFRHAYSPAFSSSSSASSVSSSSSP